MKKLLVVVLKQDTDVGPNKNGDMFVPGRLSVTEVRRAGFVEQVRHTYRNWRGLSTVNDMRSFPDTGLTIGVQITTDQYATLLGMSGVTHSITERGYASMDLIQAPKPDQSMESPVEI